MADHAVGRVRGGLRTPRHGPYSSEEIAAALVPRRDRLVEQLPRELAIARGLSRDQAELVVDEAIDYLVTQYPKPLREPEGLERAFWAAAGIRVRRMHEGRGSTVRAGWRRVDLDGLEVPSVESQPEAAAIERTERAALLEFVATLSDVERRVLARKYASEARVAGRVRIARDLDLPIGEVRKAERAIQRKLERFIAIMAAGSLCAHRAPLVAALATGSLGEESERLARLHLAHCSACRLDYAARLRALKSGKLPREVANLLPVPVVEGARNQRGPWDAFVEWASRPFAHDAVVTGSQLGTAGRGLGTLALAKIAVACIGGATIVAGGVYCLSSPDVLHHHRADRHAEARHRRVKEQGPRAPVADRHRPVVLKQATATPTATATATATPTPRPQLASSASSSPTAHETAGAVSPPPAGSAAAGGSEFGPQPDQSAASSPAAAAGGGPEFP